MTTAEPQRNHEIHAPSPRGCGTRAHNPRGPPGGPKEVCCRPHPTPFITSALLRRHRSERALASRSTLPTAPLGTPKLYPRFSIDRVLPGTQDAGCGLCWGAHPSPKPYRFCVRPPQPALWCLLADLLIVPGLEMHAGPARWRGGDALEGGEVPPAPSTAPSLCPATVSLTPGASFKGICNRQ